MVVALGDGSVGTLSMATSAYTCWAAITPDGSEFAPLD